MNAISILALGLRFGNGRRRGRARLCGFFPEATQAMERIGSFVKQRIPENRNAGRSSTT